MSNMQWMNKELGIPAFTPAPDRLYCPQCNQMPAFRVNGINTHTVRCDRCRLEVTKNSSESVLQAWLELKEKMLADKRQEGAIR